MAWVLEPALFVTAELRSEDILLLATLVLATLVLHMAEAVSMEALAHYQWLELFRVPQSDQAPYLFRVRHSWAADFRTLAASVRMAADMLGHTAIPDTTTSVYRTWVTQWVAIVPPARLRQER